MSYQYSVPEEGMEDVIGLADKALVLLATQNPAAIKLAEAYLAICHNALVSGVVDNEMRPEHEPEA